MVKRTKSKTKSGEVHRKEGGETHQVKPSWKEYRVPTSGVCLFCLRNAKAMALCEYVKASQEKYEVTESALVKDILYAYQAINGQFIKFDKDLDGFVV